MVRGNLALRATPGLRAQLDRPWLIFLFFAFNHARRGAGGACVWFSRFWFVRASCCFCVIVLLLFFLVCGVVVRVMWDQMLFVCL